MKRTAPRSSVVRHAVGALVALLVAGMLTLGMTGTASAAVGQDFTVMVTTKAGLPLTGVKIYAAQTVDGHGVANDPEPKAKAVAHEAGFYSFSGASQLIAGATYTLIFFPSSTSTTFSQYLGGTSIIDHAQTFVVGTETGQVTSLSTSLATNASISGTVKGTTGSALKGATIDAIYDNGDVWYLEEEVVSSSTGKYSLTDLQPGSYKLEAFYPSEKHAPAFSGGATTFDTATATFVGLGGKAAVNLAFPHYTGSIIGAASFEYYSASGEDEGQGSLSKALPAAYPVTTEGSGGHAAAIDVNRVTYGKRVSSGGGWSITGLAPGYYVVRMFPWYYNEPADYLGASGDTSFTSAQMINVGTTLSYAPDASFAISAQGGALTVSVTDPSSAPRAGENVLLQRESDPDEYYSGKTNAAGTISFGESGKYNVIRPGMFTLSVSSSDGSTEPYQQPYDLVRGRSSQTVSLAAVTHVPGFSTPPAIAQTATTVGTSYTVAANPNRSGASMYYEWLRAGQVIDGADSATYQSRVSDIGKQLSVRVEADLFGFDPVYATASVAGLVTDSATMPLQSSPATLSPKGDGAASPGTVLTATPGVWNVAGLTYTYHWFRDGVPFDNSGSSYVVTVPDLTHQFTVTVSASELGYPTPPDTPATNTVTPVTGDEPVAEAALVVTAKKKTSTTYTVAPGKWSGLNPSFTYAWSRDNQIVGTGSSLVESSSKANLAQPLTVEVTATEDGFAHPGHSFQIARKASAPLKPQTTPAASLSSGGSTLAASTIVAANQTAQVDEDAWAGTFAVDDFPDVPDYSYQWYLATGSATPKAIVGATASSYVIPVTTVGKKLSVVVTVRSSLWAAGVSARIPAGTIASATALVDDAPSATITIGGDLLPAADNLWPSYDWGKWTADNPATITYQWYSCLIPTCTTSSPTTAFTAMHGNTDSTTFLPATATGEFVFVRATAAKPGFVTAHVDSRVVQVAAQGIFVLANPSFVSVLSNPVPVRVGALSYVETPLVGNPYVYGLTDQYTSVAQTCSSDCSSVDADWEPVSGTIIPAITNEYPNTPPEYTPNVADYANGNGWVRIVETVDATGYQEKTVTSAPVKIALGTYTQPSNQKASLVQTDGTDDTSKTFSVSAPSYLGTAPTIQWFEGTDPIDGDSQVVENPTVPGVPEYAVVKWDIPGYNEVTQVLAARYLPYPTVAPAANSIIGTTFGQTLSVAVPDPWGLSGVYPYAPGTLTYSWSSTSGNPNYTPQATSIGQKLGTTIYYSNPLFVGQIQTQVQMSSPLLGKEIDDLAAAPTLSWSGPLVPYTQVRVSSPSFSPAGVTTSYVWQYSANGTTWLLTGGYSQTFTPPLYMGGDELRVVVTGAETGYASDVEYSDTEPIQIGDIVQDFTAPALSGDATVGGTVTLDPGVWSSDSQLAIQWYLSGIAIPGATGKSYQPLSNNVGGDLSVQITGSIPGQTSVTAKSNVLIIGQAAAPTQLSLSRITGKGTVASPLSVSTGAWSVGGLEYSYQWSDASGPIDGATTNTLVLPAGDTVASVSVTITATRVGYADATVSVP